jgi:cell division inhibitor SepF
MNALRKAGVWLGLVADDEERPGEAYDDEFADDDDFTPAARPRAAGRPRSAARTADARGGDARAYERGTTRDLRVAEPRAPERDLYERREADRDRRDAERRDADRRDTDRRDTERRDAERREADRAASVRPLARPGSTGDRPYAEPPRPHTGERAYPTQDNLALAPQVHLRERAVVSEEAGRRYQITTLHPTSYSEARTIGEHFRDGYPVIMNLTEMDEPDAKRLVDFAAGLAFGVRGSMERVTNRVFLLSPPNIQVSAEDKARIAEGGFFGQS